MKKTTKKYYFTVEGNIEKLYLTWLANKINENEKRLYNVKFDIKSKKGPISFAKGISVIEPIEVFHIIDIESQDQEHKNRFKNELDDLQYVTKKMSNKVKKYCLGYNNFTFDLWIILHKLDAYTSLNHRKDYLSLINSGYKKNFESLKEYKQEKEFLSILYTLDLANVIDAIKRAKIIMKTNKKNGYVLHNYKTYHFYCENPAISTHEIIEDILLEVKIIEQ